MRHDTHRQTDQFIDKSKVHHNPQTYGREYIFHSIHYIYQLLGLLVVRLQKCFFKLINVLSEIIYFCMINYCDIYSYINPC